MAMSNLLLITMTIFVLTIVTDFGSASLCVEEHPQTAVCRADFVIKARIISNNWQPANQKKDSKPSYRKPQYMQVELRKVYKGSKYVNATKYSRVIIMVASPQRMSLEEGHNYVLTGFSFGTILYMNHCNWNSKWHKLTLAQKYGIALYRYLIYCQCRIVECTGESCHQDRRSCSWHREANSLGCLSENKICMVRNGVRCDWMGPRTVSCDIP